MPRPKGKKQFVDQRTCFVSGCADVWVRKGLCPKHSKEVDNHGVDRSNEMAMYELHQSFFPRPMSHHRFHKNLLTITKHLPVGRQLKTDFITRMNAAYQQGSDD